MFKFKEGEIELIYKNYMEMDSYKAEDYIKSIADKKTCSDKVINNHISKYAKKLGEVEYKKYLQRVEDVRLKKYDYVKIVESLLEKNKYGETINYRDYGYKSEIIHFVERYYKHYPEKQKELDVLKQSIELYFKDEKELLKLLPMGKEEIIKVLENQNKQFEYNVNIINTFLSSNYSIEEYCHYNLQLNMNQLEQIIKMLFKNKWKNVILATNKLVNQNFIIDLGNIIEKMKNENYDYIDYYMDTKLSFNDLFILSKKYKLDSITVSKFSNRYRHKLIVINRESELNTTNIISGRTITREEKLKIFTFLDENQIPVNLHSYKLAITKYLNNEIDIETKHYTKKI